MDEHEFDALLLRPFAREDFQRGRKLEWDAAERSPPRFSVERPRTCAVNWLLPIRKSLRALPWRISGTWNGTFRRFQAWF
jgi:hypothetical protein